MQRLQWPINEVLMTSSDAHPIVMWELTRACDMHCRNCSIGATSCPGANELTTYEVYKTIDQIDVLAPREFIITGGDPLAREDIVQIVSYARRRGLDPAARRQPDASVDGRRGDAEYAEKNLRDLRVSA
jgi:MoaA/NifB/PqqE/SkfB family radical SAM enzyme